MPTCGMSIVTRGMIYPPSRIDVVVCDKPIMQATDLKPSVTIDILPVPVVDPVPTIRAAAVLKPKVSASTRPPLGPGAHPTIISAPELKPVIIKAEEEE